MLSCACVHVHVHEKSLIHIALERRKEEKEKISKHTCNYYTHRQHIVHTNNSFTSLEILSQPQWLRKISNSFNGLEKYSNLNLNGLCMRMQHAKLHMSLIHKYMNMNIYMYYVYVHVLCHSTLNEHVQCTCAYACSALPFALRSSCTLYSINTVYLVLSHACTRTVHCTYTVQNSLNLYMYMYISLRLK